MQAFIHKKYVLIEKQKPKTITFKEKALTTLNENYDRDNILFLLYGETKKNFTQFMMEIC